jgi:hypothetical protein
MINWHDRYAKIIYRNKELLDTNKSVLEIGSGLNGIARYLKRPVAAIDNNIEGKASEYLSIAKGDVLNLDILDNSYDYAVCVDVLEHIQPSLRAKAIREMLRVTRDRLIISCPCDKIAYKYEVHFSKILRKVNCKTPEWLSEHLKNGLPEVSDILKILTELRVEFVVTGNEGIMQHYGGLLLDIQFNKMKKIYESHENKACFTAPIGASEWDRCYSYLFEINKNKKQSTNLIKCNSPDTGPTCNHQNSTAVYSVFHQDIDSNYLNEIIPIYAGRVAEKKRQIYLTDRLENSPSLSNTRWSELSAIYKIWKEGPHTDVIGFTHYRRLFNFNKQSDKDTAVLISTLIEYHLKDIYDNDYICSLIDNGICVAKPLKLTGTLWDQYCDNHSTNDWCWVLSKISRDYPHLMEHALEQFEDTYLYACNMFITNWSKFYELCSLWYDILLEFESQVPSGRSNSYQNRDISFMAERIFDIWIRYKKSKGEDVRELPIFFVKFNKDDENGEHNVHRNYYTSGPDLPSKKWSNRMMAKIKTIFTSTVA